HLLTHDKEKRISKHPASYHKVIAQYHAHYKYEEESGYFEILSYCAERMYY
ncbi:hypothetical protein ig2599ANME_0919, partial [groundwater metagenome]